MDEQIITSAEGYLPLFNRACEVSAKDLASSLVINSVQEIPYKRIPVPVELETHVRLSYICDKYNVSFAQLISSLINVALPQLEHELDIKEEDVCTYFSENKPKGLEDMTAITSDQLSTIIEQFKKEAK